MGVNLDKPQRWKRDIARSVDLYNQWFFDFAPETFISTRERATAAVEDALVKTSDLMDVSPQILMDHPSIISMLRMTTAPPIAKDRLIGLSKVPDSLVDSMEKSDNPRIPPRLPIAEAITYLERIGSTIERLADRSLFPWVEEQRSPSEVERRRAATVVADRLTGSIANPLMRNAQEAWQLEIIGSWLEKRGYTHAPAGTRFTDLSPGQYAFRLNASGQLETGKPVSIPIDVVILPLSADPDDLPLLVEAKSAGDFANTNKRRKEEANKIANLRRLHGTDVRFILYLRGYFDSPYLGFSASEGIDWVWEHRTDDLASFGV